jgi:hypothetical protein
MRVPKINFQRQSEIAEELMQLENQTIETIKLLSNSISLLNEYKTALITACVTGIIEINSGLGIG